MARLYADEQYPYPVVEFLRALGHDVLTVQEAGKANQRISDPDVLAFATRRIVPLLLRIVKISFGCTAYSQIMLVLSPVRTTVIGRHWLTESTLQLQRKNLCKGN